MICIFLQVRPPAGVCRFHFPPHAPVQSERGAEPGLDLPGVDVQGEGDDSLLELLRINPISSCKFVFMK